MYSHSALTQSIILAESKPKKVPTLIQTLSQQSSDTIHCCIEELVELYKNKNTSHSLKTHLIQLFCKVVLNKNFNTLHQYNLCKLLNSITLYQKFIEFVYTNELNVCKVLFIDLLRFACINTFDQDTHTTNLMLSWILDNRLRLNIPDGTIINVVHSIGRHQSCTAQIFDLIFRLIIRRNLGCEDKWIILMMNKPDNWIQPEHFELFLQYVRDQPTRWIVIEYVHNYLNPNSPLQQLEIIQNIRNLYIERQRQEGVNHAENRDVYRNNSQNVHMLDSKRTAMVEWLIKNVKIVDNDKLLWALDNITLYNHMLESTIVDIRMFDHRMTEFGLTVYDMFSRICCFIHDLPTEEQKTECLHRLCEELRDMKGTCISGHINRLFLSLYGFWNFTDITEYDLNNFCNTTLQEHLSTLQKNENSEEKSLVEDIVLGMLDGDYSDDVNKYIQKLGNDTLKEAYVQFKPTFTEEKINSSMSMTFASIFSIQLSIIKDEAQDKSQDTIQDKTVQQETQLSQQIQDQAIVTVY